MSVLWACCADFQTSLILTRTENPCPEQGDIIQIKLSEHTEVLPKADGTGSTTMLVDTVFEMNYSTGQWTRLKKYKPITNTSWGTGNTRTHTFTYTQIQHVGFFFFEEEGGSDTDKSYLHTNIHTIWAKNDSLNNCLDVREVFKSTENGLLVLQSSLPVCVPVLAKIRDLLSIFLFLFSGSLYIL